MSSQFWKAVRCLCLAAVWLLPSCTSGVPAPAQPIFAPATSFGSGPDGDGAEPSLVDYDGRLYAVALTPTGAYLWGEAGDKRSLRRLMSLDQGLGRGIDVDVTSGQGSRAGLFVADDISGRGIAIMQSRDGGHNFQLLSVQDRGYDRPWLLAGGSNQLFLFDTSDRPPRIHLSVSDDGGASFRDLFALQLGADAGGILQTVVMGRPDVGGYGFVAPVVLTSVGATGRTTQELEALLAQPTFELPGNFNSNLQGRLFPVAGGGAGTFQGFPVAAGGTFAYSGVGAGDGKRHVWLTEADIFDGYGKEGPVHLGQAPWSKPVRLDRGAGEAVFPQLALTMCGLEAAWLQSDGIARPSWRLMFGYQPGCKQSNKGSISRGVAASPRDTPLTPMTLSADAIHHGEICLGGEACLADRSLLDFVSLVGVSPQSGSGCNNYLVIAYAEDASHGNPRLQARRQTGGPCDRSISFGRAALASLPLYQK